MPAASTSSSYPKRAGALTWRPTKVMNVHDLSNDDDFLSHLLVEKLGTGEVPLVVHKMDASAKLPKTDADDLMNLVQRLVITRGPVQQSVKQAVDELLTFLPVRYYLKKKKYDQKQINAFATHASRYFELYHPSGVIEIAHTSRYSSHTGKSELCVLATRPLAPGTVITELKGSMANLSAEEDKELKRAAIVDSDIRRDFSVIHSKSMKKNHLFLGPARFVNHDCNNNCELFREGRYITFRVLRPIGIGEEITAHYGDGYFGKKNRHCLCESCEKNGRGGYAPVIEGADAASNASSDSDSESDSDSSSSDAESEPEKPVNLDERRTRRGVYATIANKNDSSDESDNENDDEAAGPSRKATDATGTSEGGLDSASELTSLSASASLGITGPSNLKSLSTLSVSRSSSLSSLSSTPEEIKAPKPTVALRSTILTRGQSRELQTASRASTSQPSAPEAPTADDLPLRRSSRASTSILASRNRTSSTNEKGKDKESPTPAPTPVSTRDRNTPRSYSVVKKDEAEQRVLRTRPSAVTAVETKESPAPKEPPRGPDGKLLPTCSTCDNILPVIVVDSKVIWGMVPEGKRGKKKKHDCPRCLRHFAIYQQTWPARLPAPGVPLPSPCRPSTPALDLSKSTHKVLRYLERQAEVSAVSRRSPFHRAKKREREESAEPTPPPTKRTRMESMPGKPTPMAASIAPSTSEEPVKRKRGRPRLTSPRYKPKVKATASISAPPPRAPPAARVAPVSVKVEEELESVSPKFIPMRSKRIFDQPRANNGRFGKKDKHAKKGASDSPRSPKVRRTRASAKDAPTSPTWTSPRRRGINDADVQMQDVPSNGKRPRSENTRTEEPMASSSKYTMPRSTSTFRGPRLFSNPNPHNFAAYSRATKASEDEDSLSDDTDSDDSPETPEEPGHSPGAEIAEGKEQSPLFLPAPSFRRAPLTFKPTPSTFSKRRWVSFPRQAQLVVDEDEDEEDEDEPEQEAAAFGTPGGVSCPPRWSKLGDDVSSVSSNFNLTPVEISAVYPLQLIPQDNCTNGTKRNAFPEASAASVGASFLAVPRATHTPYLVDAGWDSSSDVSDI